MPAARLPALLVCCALSWSLAATADDYAAAPLFADPAALAVRIEVPLREIMRNRDDGEYRDGSLQYTDAAGVVHSLDLKVRARGKYRRRNDVCRFAPLRLNFKKSQVDGTVFAGQDKLKLVTHCQTSRSAYEQYLLKEYLSYRIFQALTDNSFAVRLLRAQWIDSEDAKEAIERYAFVIEDDDRLAERLGTRVAEVNAVRTHELVAQQSALVAVFEYLIGNTDYSLLRGPADDYCCHNAVLLEHPAGKHLPIPYDFDFSGLVSTPYAEPNPALSIKSVRTRLYRGYCNVNAEMRAALPLLRDKEPAIRALIANQPGLEKKMADRALKFVDRFYEDINSPSRVERKLADRCR